MVSSTTIPEFISLFEHPTSSNDLPSLISAVDEQLSNLSDALDRLDSRHDAKSDQLISVELENQSSHSQLRSLLDTENLLTANLANQQRRLKDLQTSISSENANLDKLNRELKKLRDLRKRPDKVLTRGVKKLWDKIF